VHATSLENFSDSLREYRQSLLVGSQSPLTPMQQYLETQLEYERVRGLAQAGDKDAMQRLNSVASTFLQASQRMYASSAEYVQDFNEVTTDVSNVANYADTQASIADRTLAALETQFSTMVDISQNTRNTVVALTGLGTELTNALAEYTRTIELSLGNYAEQVATVVAVPQAPAPTPVAPAGFTLAAQDWYAPPDYSSIGAAMGAAFEMGGIRKYATGGVVSQMTPFVHSGGLGIMGEAGPEAIMPLQRMPGGQLGVALSGDMQQQLARLNQQVAELTQVVANGAVMNAQATDRNTEAVVAAVGDSAESTVYQNRLNNRTRVV